MWIPVEGSYLWSFFEVLLLPRRSSSRDLFVGLDRGTDRGAVRGTVRGTDRATDRGTVRGIDILAVGRSLKFLAAGICTDGLHQLYFRYIGW